MKGELRPANFKYDNSAPADEDLDEIEEWPAMSDKDVDEPIVQPVVEVVNREDGRQANIESPITQLDFTMSAPVGPSVDILANMPPPHLHVCHHSFYHLHSCCDDTTSNFTHIARSPSGPAGKITRGAGRSWHFDIQGEETI